jgi:hypothetical protein
VYLALSRFRNRPTDGQLPRGLPADLWAFFGPFAEARRHADDLLFRGGDADASDEAAKRSAVGKAPGAGGSAHTPAHTPTAQPACVRMRQDATGRRRFRCKDGRTEHAGSRVPDAASGVSRVRARNKGAEREGNEPGLVARL